MNKDIVNKMLYLSEQIRPLIYGKRQIEAAEECLAIAKETAALNDLKEAKIKVTYRILRAKEKIFELYYSLDGYLSTFNKVEYIPKNDVDTGFLCVMIGEKEETYLNLSTGEFVSIEKSNLLD